VSRRDEVIDAAERILEAEGLDAVTMRRLAAELGMQAPSLYKHVKDKAEIEAALQERALRQQAAVLGDAVDLQALAVAYRRWALEHPGLYVVSAERPLHRGLLAPGIEDAAVAPLMRVAGGDADLVRALWGLAHGLVALELAGRFPDGTDVGAAWDAGIKAFSGGRRRRSTSR
jgi:AcrR family transcriptional regulator